MSVQLNKCTESKCNNFTFVIFCVLSMQSSIYILQHNLIISSTRKHIIIIYLHRHIYIPQTFMSVQLNKCTESKS